MTKPALDRQIADLVDKVIKDRTLAKYLKSDAARGLANRKTTDENRGMNDAEEWDNMPV